MDTPETYHLLVVIPDRALNHAIIEAISEMGPYTIRQADNFDDAMNELLRAQFDLVITEVKLADLSGIDLLNAIGKMRPETRAILIDNDLSAKAAVSAFRLGAVDYLCKPVNLELIMMQVGRVLEQAEGARRVAGSKRAPTTQRTVKDQERRLNPETRAAGLILKPAHFKAIDVALSQLMHQVTATFIGLLDEDGNVIGAKGKTEHSDLLLLKKALAGEREKTRLLADVLEERKFRANYYEGEQRSVYLLDFGETYRLTLTLICPSSTRPGTAWLEAKRAAGVIEKTIEEIRVTRTMLKFDPETPQSPN